jgi:hypothetical protein
MVRVEHVEALELACADVQPRAHLARRRFKPPLDKVAVRALCGSERELQRAVLPVLVGHVRELTAPKRVTDTTVIRRPHQPRSKHSLLAHPARNPPVEIVLLAEVEKAIARGTVCRRARYKRARVVERFAHMRKQSTISCLVRWEGNQ